MSNGTQAQEALVDEVRGRSRANVGPSDYVTYRGGTGMWAWLFHRLTGLGVLLFVLIHVVDTALIGWGPHVYNEAVHLYRTVPFRIGEILLFGAVLFHALNGVRIIIMDFWPRTSVAEKKLFYGVIALFVVFYIPVVAIMVNSMIH